MTRKYTVHTETGNHLVEVQIERIGHVQAVEIHGLESKDYKLGGYRLQASIDGQEEPAAYMPWTIENAELVCSNRRLVRRLVGHKLTPQIGKH